MMLQPSHLTDVAHHVVVEAELFERRQVLQAVERGEGVAREVELGEAAVLVGEERSAEVAQLVAIAAQLEHVGPPLRPLLGRRLFFWRLAAATGAARAGLHGSVVSKRRLL